MEVGLVFAAPIAVVVEYRWDAADDGTQVVEEHP